MRLWRLWNPRHALADELAAFSWQAGIYRVTFSIAHGGLWSPRQAFRVAEAVRAEALAVGLMLVPVWVRGSMPTRVVLLVLCRRHAIEVAPKGRGRMAMSDETPVERRGAAMKVGVAVTMPTIQVGDIVESTHADVARVETKMEAELWNDNRDLVVEVYRDPLWRRPAPMPTKGDES